MCKNSDSFLMMAKRRQRAWHLCLYNISVPTQSRPLSQTLLSLVQGHVCEDDDRGELGL